MQFRAMARRFVALSVLVLATSCSSDDKSGSQGSTPATCKKTSNEGCTAPLVCEETTAGATACFAPVQIVGTVSNALDGQPIEGALVVARDANGAAVTGTAITDSTGEYSLRVPVTRDTSGDPATGIAFTLRADASAYQTFPTAPRVAIPIKVTEPKAGIVQSAATNIGLIPLPNAAGAGTITGTISADDPTGTLIVAGGATALAATDGSFTIFNVPAGNVEVTAYRQGINFAPQQVEVSAKLTTQGVTLIANAKPAVTVSGKVDIVNPGNGTDTSVILVVSDTFVANAARGEAPPGLRVAGISGNFSISGVPDGKYVVLAAFENDYLVRDPDLCIGGTAIVTVVVAGSDVTIDESFKITGSLDVVSPDAEQSVSGTPTFVWADDSSEDSYAISVYDAFGTLIWEDANIPSVSGNKNVSVAYAGPALTPGMLYQFRATSVRKNDCAISRTEDLRGVFKAQ